MSYKIANIFSSIQGEGSFIGTAFSFVRFYGCDLKCDFCDDELHKSVFTNMSGDEILDKLSLYKTKNVVITGGEPSIQDINPLITTLQNRGYFVAIETNGLNIENIKQANWITYSPKNLTNLLQEGFSEIKFLIDKDTDFSAILKYRTNKPKFLQPINESVSINTANIRRCIELVEKYPEFRLSPQLHKFLGVE